MKGTFELRILVSLVVFATSLFGSAARADTAESCARAAEAASDLRQAGRFVEALPTFLRCARDECPRVVRNDCRRALAELRTDAPHIAVRVRDAEGHDVVGASISVDGAAWTADDQANGRLVDPGTHVVRATVDLGERAQSPVEQQVVIARTDRTRTIDLVLAPPDTASSSLPPPALTPMPSERRDRRAAYVAGAVGLSFLTTAAALGAWSVLDYRRLETSCAPHCFPAESDAIHTRALVADVALGAAVVSAGVAVVLWLTAPSGDGSLRSARSRAVGFGE